MSKTIISARQSFRLQDALASLTRVTVAAGLLMALPLADATLQTGFFQEGAAFAQRASEQRPPPEARSAGTLSRPVVSVIERVMELRDMEDIAGAMNELGRLREMFDRDRLNEYETYTMWQFYANLAYLQEDIEGALQYYYRMIEVPNLTPERLEQGWFFIAQLHFVQEEWQEAIDAFNEYLEIAATPDKDVYLRIGQAYYQLEQYQESIPWVLRNMEALRAEGTMVPQSTYQLLRALYFTLEDYQKAYQVLREMVVLYNDPEDWGYLAAVNGQLERFEDQAEVYYVAHAADYLDSQAEFVNLAAQMSQFDNPFGAAVVMEEGIEKGIVEETEDNLVFLSQFWQLAREDERALDPLIRAAEMTGDPELYARLGRIYMTLGDFGKAVEAFNTAFREESQLDRPDQAYLQLARAYWELNCYDQALRAARQARADERSRDTADTYVTVLTREKARYESLEEQREAYKDYFKPGTRTPPRPSC